MLLKISSIIYLTIQPGQLQMFIYKKGGIGLRTL